MKAVLSLILSILLVLPVLSGCQAEGTAISSQMGSSGSAGHPSDEVIARVGETEILYSQLADQMVMLESMYRELSEQFSPDELQVKLHASALSALENLIAQQILYSKINTYGLSLTPEEEKDAQAAWGRIVASIGESVKNTYPELEGDELERMIQAAVDASGQQEDTVVANARQAILVSKLKHEVLTQVERPSREDVEEAYQGLLKQQQESYTHDVTGFEADMLAGAPVVFVPEEYRMIQEIYLKFDPEVVELLMQMKPYDSDESDSYEEIRALEYERLQKGRLPDVQKRLAEGTPFQQIMEEVKPGSQDTFNYVCQNTTRLSKEYFRAAMSLAAIGEITQQPIQMEHGYMLLCWADTLPPGVRPLSQVYDALEEQLYEQKKNDFWNETQTQWREEAEVVIYEDRLGY